MDAKMEVGFWGSKGRSIEKTAMVGVDEVTISFNEIGKKPVSIRIVELKNGNMEVRIDDWKAEPIAFVRCDR